MRIQIRLQHAFSKDIIMMGRSFCYGRCSRLQMRIISSVQPGGHKEMSSILLINSALVYEPKCGGMGVGEVAGSQPMSTTMHMDWDLTPHLTYEYEQTDTTCDGFLRLYSSIVFSFKSRFCYMLTYSNKKSDHYCSVCTRVADPDPGSGAFLTPGSVDLYLQCSFPGYETDPIQR